MASAFTYQDGSNSIVGNSNFDIEEQARKFSEPKATTKEAVTTPDKDNGAIETPYGTLRFGVQSNSSVFGAPFSSTFSARARDDQRHFDRMTSPMPIPEDAR
jgi:hypothetical protein